MAVHVAADPAKSVVRERPIDGRAFMADGTAAPERIRAAEGELRIGGLELLDQNSVAIVIQENPVLARTRVVLPLPD